MSAFYVPAADARLASSLLLLRDGAAGMEVLMLRRAERDNDIRGGAAVFPGGVLDKRDRAAHVHCLGPDDATASAQLGLAEGGLDYFVAAVRETFEEVGLLMATKEVDLPALEHWRDKLHDNNASMADFCEQERITLDLRGLAYYSHWLTPPGTPKRFDTRFFATLAPVGQVAKPDLGEAVELMWITPSEAMSAGRGLKLMPVTRRTLMDLSRFATAQAAMDDIAARTDILMIMPHRVMTAKGSTVVLPHDWAYAEVGKLDPEGKHQTTVSSEIVPGRAVQLSPRIWRVTAPNPGMMTGPGTNSYLVGDVAANGELTVIDPGPESADHTQALQAAAQAAGGKIVRILATHTHHDHSPGAAALAAATGAPVFGRIARFPERQDASFAPQRELQDGERLTLAPGTTLRVIHTPGHASNHLCFLLEEEKLLFTGDHVMQGSTVVINPPDGDMGAYLAALKSLLDEDIEWFAPGHGFLVAQPQQALRGLIAHRLKREAKVLAAVKAAGPSSIESLVPKVYDDVAPALHAMAQRSLLAHLQKLKAEGVVHEAAGVWSLA